MKKLSKQAENSLELYKGQNPSKIVQLLSIQGNVKNELMEYFGTKDINECALRCSMGFYKQV